MNETLQDRTERKKKEAQILESKKEKTHNRKMRKK